MTDEDGKSWLPPAIGALVVWGLWAFLPKMAMQGMHPRSVIFYEGIGNLFISAPILVHLKFRLQRDKKALKIMFCSSVLTVGAILSYFYALKTGPVAVVVTMTAMYPVISLILARVVLKERINKVQFAAMLMALASILLLAWPG